MLLFSLDLQGPSGIIDTTPPPPPGTIWSFASYPDFRTRVQQLIDGDDVSTSTMSTQILDLIISMGEKRLYREIRSSTMHNLQTLVVTSNSAPIPYDLLEIRALYNATGRVLKYITFEELQTLVNVSQTTWQNTIWYTQLGDSLTFFPIQPDGSLIQCHYHKYFNSIVTQGLNGNNFFARYPELFIYASLVESAPYVGEQSRMPIWEKRLDQLQIEVKNMEFRRFHRASKMQTRVA